MLLVWNVQCIYEICVLLDLPDSGYPPLNKAVLEWQANQYAIKI